MHQAQLEFDNLKDLYRCYMPFLKHGGLFVRTMQQVSMHDDVVLRVMLPDALEVDTVNGKVVWVTPHGSQSSSPTGYGVTFTEKDHLLKDKIEKLLGAMLNSTDPTFTI